MGELQLVTSEFCFWSEPGGRLHVNDGASWPSLCGKTPVDEEDWQEFQPTTWPPKPGEMCTVCRVFVLDRLAVWREAERREETRRTLKAAWARYHAENETHDDG